MLINIKGYLFTPTKLVCFTHPSCATFFHDEDTVHAHCLLTVTPLPSSPQTSPLKLPAITVPRASSPPPPQPQATPMPFTLVISTSRISSISSVVNYLFSLCFPQIGCKAPYWKSQVQDIHVLFQSLLNAYFTPSTA